MPWQQPHWLMPTRACLSSSTFLLGMLWRMAPGGGWRPYGGWRVAASRSMTSPNLRYRSHPRLQLCLRCIRTGPGTRNHAAMAGILRRFGPPSAAMALLYPFVTNAGARDGKPLAAGGAPRASPTATAAVVLFMNANA